jgi:2-polyprenyl-3-methyl-5-hydroxy-6-metoxy-1,4-benzoquinol methylase
MPAKLILDHAREKEEYVDGAEQELLSLFTSENVEEKVKEILGNNPTWSMRYHLSPVRENLLNWYEYTPEGSLLEIGAGCGAVTGAFCEKLSTVVAVELETTRAKILAARHKKRDNLTVMAGSIHDMDIKEQFDYVTCIGVLEYAGMFTPGETPFADFLHQLQQYLKPGGTFFLAIENKFGLKYWSGVGEDHSGKLFESVENYPYQKEIQTFGKKELSDLLSQAGLSDLQWYYPLPDYKLPTELFSDAYPPTINHNIREGIWPSMDFVREREHFFLEQRVSDAIITNDEFGFFANSFLVAARKAE